jgi:hypothetical protein
MPAAAAERTRFGSIDGEELSQVEITSGMIADGL